MPAITHSRTDETSKPFITAERSPDERYPIDLPRLLRLQGRLAALVEELRSMPQGSMGLPSLATVWRELLTEADEVVPAELLAELHRLIASPSPGTETERDMRVAITALEAWLEGLVAQCGMTVAAIGPPPA